METGKLKLTLEKCDYSVYPDKGVVVCRCTFSSGNFITKTKGIAICDYRYDTFNEKTGKKIARAKAEKAAFINFRNECSDFLDFVMRKKAILDTTIDFMENLIDHQNLYLKSFR